MNSVIIISIMNVRKQRRWGRMEHIEKLIQNNMQVIEELHHKIIFLEEKIMAIENKIVKLMEGK